MADGKIVYKVEIDDKDAAAEGERAGGKAGNALLAKLKGGLGTAAKIGAAAVMAASGALIAFGKQAVAAYADYEQLAGGVETLFKESSDTVMQYAENAYKTAGLSANQYMETVTSFSASLLQSVGGDTEKAAAIADQAITDMADNANKMGSSIESIQTAYQGFAKQNYTMLDNLKLGYGGTKSEMERLLADATALSGVEYDINSLSDVYEAIHVIQTELDITGTTAKEASTTISGSISSMKAAWENLLTGFGDKNANMEKLVGDLVSSAETVVQNILPVAEQVFTSLLSVTETMVPTVVERGLSLITENLPMVIETAMALVLTLTDTIVSMAPMILQTGVECIVQLALGLSEALPELIPACVSAIMEIVDTLTRPDMITQLIGAALALIMALANGLINAMPELLARAPQIIFQFVAALLQNSPQVLAAGARLIVELIAGIVSMFLSLFGVGDEAVQGFKEKIFNAIDNAKTWGQDLINNFISGIKAKFQALKDTVTNIANTIKSFLGFSEPEEGPLSNFHTYAPDMIALFSKGIKDGKKDIQDALNDTLGAAFEPVDVNMTRRDDIERNVSYAMSAGRLSDMTITVPLYLDGREIARATAWSMGEQLAWEEM